MSDNTNGQEDKKVEGEEVNAHYRCPVDNTHWSGIKGEVPTKCPECGADAVEVNEDGSPIVAEVTEDAKPEERVVPTGETAKYRVIGLVDVFDEQNNITGQYPIGSVQELTVARGEDAVRMGTAELVTDEANAVE